jgi:hypothetical protein
VPRLEVGYSAGTFGGGMNERVGDFGGRGDGTAQMVWETHNLFAGDVARARARRSEYNQANIHVVEVQARVAAEVTAAAKLARSRQRTLATAQEAVRQAMETWRRLREAAFGMDDPHQRLLDSLEPLVAEQALDTARTQYLTEVIEFNKAQFRLYTALGQPPQEALPAATALPVDVPVVPQAEPLGPSKK